MKILIFLLLFCLSNFASAQTFARPKIRTRPVIKKPVVTTTEKVSAKPAAAHKKVDTGTIAESRSVKVRAKITRGEDIAKDIKAGKEVVIDNFLQLR